MCTNKDNISDAKAELKQIADLAIERFNILIDVFYMTLKCEDDDPESNISNARKLEVMTECFFNEIKDDFSLWKWQYGSDFEEFEDNDA